MPALPAEKWAARHSLGKESLPSRWAKGVPPCAGIREGVLLALHIRACGWSYKKCLFLSAAFSPGQAVLPSFSHACFCRGIFTHSFPAGSPVGNHPPMGATPRAPASKRSLHLPMSTGLSSVAGHKSRGQCWWPFSGLPSLLPPQCPWAVPRAARVRCVALCYCLG